MSLRAAICSLKTRWQWHVRPLRPSALYCERRELTCFGAQTHLLRIGPNHMMVSDGSSLETKSVCEASCGGEVGQRPTKHRAPSAEASGSRCDCRVMNVGWGRGVCWKRRRAVSGGIIKNHRDGSGMKSGRVSEKGLPRQSTNA